MFIQIYEKFDSEEQAVDYMNKMYENYHPAGYGTVLDVYQLLSGQWVVDGYRYDSCD